MEGMGDVYRATNLKVGIFFWLNNFHAWLYIPAYTWL